MSKLPAEMPQEDTESKSKLDLILSKIAELWTGVTSKFDTLTNHIDSKTSEINVNTNSRGAITRDEVNVHTTNKLEEFKALMGKGVVKSVQRGKYQYNDYSKYDQPISISAVDVNKTIVLLNCSGYYSRSYTDSINAFANNVILLSLDSLSFNISVTSIGSYSSCAVSWQVIEFY